MSVNIGVDRMHARTDAIRSVGGDKKGVACVRSADPAFLAFSARQFEAIEVLPLVAPHRVASVTRRVSAAGLAPPSGEIIAQIQIGGSSTDSLVQILRPSHAVVSNRRSAKEKLRPEGSPRIRKSAHVKVHC